MVIDSRLTEQRHALFETDALRALFCGTSSPAPDPRRAKACAAVFAAGRFWLVDTGPGSFNTLGVYGPPGVEQVVAGFAQAYALDSQYRVTHHGAQFMPPELGRMNAVVIPHPKYGEGPSVVLEQEGQRITAFPVRHDPVKPAYGYRFDYLGRSLVVSGDTAKSPSLVEASKGVDLLIHEAMAKHMTAAIGERAGDLDRPRIATLMADIPGYHTSAVQAAQIANETGAKLLLMYHLFPAPLDAVAESVFARGVSNARGGAWSLADDGMLISLPSGSDDLRVEHLSLR